MSSGPEPSHPTGLHPGGSCCLCVLVWVTGVLGPQGTPADVLYKGTITRIVGEDSPSRLERAREDGLPKGHVIYEGKKGHVLSYEGECKAQGRRQGPGRSSPAHARVGLCWAGLGGD